MLKGKLYYQGLVAAALITLSACEGENRSTAKQRDTTMTQTVDSASGVIEAEKSRILKFLSDIKSKYVLGGIHNREPNSKPAQWTDAVHKTVGDYPALWSGDFLFQKENIEHRETMISEAIKQFKSGAIINIMWHACNPANGQPCAWDDGKGVLSTLTDKQWEELFTEGTAIHTQFVTMMEEVAVHLRRLKDNKVVAMFRPFHEMNQGKFWWGGRPGEEGTAKLYRWVHDYMVKEKGLDNLIWVWNIQDFPSLDKDADLYNPGDRYWDIVSLDVYDDASGFSKEKYETIKRVANGKPMGIGECQKLPSVTVLQEQKDWIFFMGWSELVFEHNSIDTIKEVYGSDRVLLLKEVNGL
ncbi:glycoside hydrolase family 26 protein [Sphingobacterium olei]|nr:glycosyl hydrolase [Sphingobacterium olei]